MMSQSLDDTFAATALDPMHEDEQASLALGYKGLMEA